jgi:hypothetical protein
MFLVLYQRALELRPGALKGSDHIGMGSGWRLRSVSLLFVMQCLIVTTVSNKSTVTSVPACAAPESALDLLHSVFVTLWLEFAA